MLARSLAVFAVAFTLSRVSSAQPSARFPDPESPPSDTAEGAPGTPDVVPAHSPPPPPGAFVVREPIWQPPPRDQIAPLETDEKTRWYGWQTLIADGAALLLIGSALDDGSGELAALGVLSYFVAPPVIHGAHGRGGAALGSVGLRVGAPILGAFLGSSQDDRSGGEWGPGAGAAAGFLLGVASAIALDAALLARETVSEPERPALGVHATALPSGFSAGLSGSF